MGPGRMASDRDLGGFLQEGLWCESFRFLTSSCHLVSVVLKVGTLRITWSHHHPHPPPVKNQARWVIQFLAQSHLCPYAIHRVGKEAIVLKDELSPSILCLSLTTQPELYNGPTYSVPSSHSPLSNVHPSIHSFILSTCTRCYWSWRDRSTIKALSVEFCQSNGNLRRARECSRFARSPACRDRWYCLPVHCLVYSL